MTIPIPSAVDDPAGYLGKLVAYHEEQILALRRLAVLAGVELPLGLYLWRPWRLELLPGVHQSVMLPPGATIDGISTGSGSLAYEGAELRQGVILWLQVPLVVDPIAPITHRYVQLLPDEAHAPPDTERWLGDVLVYGVGAEPWDGTVFRCYEVPA